MKSGLLRHRVTFQYDASADGSETDDWQTLLKDWPSNVVPVSGQETFRGDQLEAKTKYVVETRFNERIEPDQRIIDHRGRALNIISVVSRAGRDRELMIQCSEVTA